MDLMKQYGVSLPKGKVATTAAGAEAIATEMLMGREGAFTNKHKTRTFRCIHRVLGVYAIALSSVS